MTKSNEQNLIAPCGMNCEICIAYYGYAMNGQKRKNKCFGCKTRDKPCAFIKKRCEKLIKNEVEYCFECNTFPCENLKKLDKRYRERFDMSMIDNLKYIKKNGISKFLNSEKEKWKCSKCGNLICVHNKICYYCLE